MDGMSLPSHLRMSRAQFFRDAHADVTVPEPGDHQAQPFHQVAGDATLNGLCQQRPFAAINGSAQQIHYGLWHWSGRDA